MIRVLHLIDDAGLGGITRLLQAQEGRLGADIRAETLVVDPRRVLAPSLPEADVVVVHFTLAWRKLPFLLALRARCGRRPLVLVEHSYTAAYEHRCVPRPGRFRAMLRLGAALFDHVVAVSHGQAAWLRAAGIVPAGKLRVIEPTSDLSAVAAVPPLAPAAGPLRLGCYGRYAPQKGLPALIEAMRLLPPGLATLQLAGYGPEEAALRAAAADLPGVEIGGVVRPEAFLAEVDAIVMPSLWEAYGLVCAEARAAGRPVLVADLDGLSEQVPAALRIPATDPVTIAERIRWLAQQDLPALGETLRITARGSELRHCRGWAGLIRDVVPGRVLGALNQECIQAPSNSP